MSTNQHQPTTELAIASITSAEEHAKRMAESVNRLLEMINRIRGIELLVSGQEISNQ